MIEKARKRGYLTAEELGKRGRFPSKERLTKGPMAIVECAEGIPCDPCVAACPFGAISKANLSTPPQVKPEKCTGCAKCVGACPGLAIFLVHCQDGQGVITLPYELNPVPEKGEEVMVLDRSGQDVGRGRVRRVQNGPQDTKLVTVEVDEKLAMEVRAIKVQGGRDGE